MAMKSHPIMSEHDGRDAHQPTHYRPHMMPPPPSHSYEVRLMSVQVIGRCLNGAPPFELLLQRRCRRPTGNETLKYVCTEGSLSGTSNCSEIRGDYL